MKKHIITIAGVPGSGKSSVADGIASILGYEHFSSGDLFRKMAMERNMSIEEINFAAEKQTEIDRVVDEFLVRLGKEKDHFVVDSRTAFHWMPDSFKVFLRLDSRIAAERVFVQIQKSERVSQSATSLDQLIENSLKRSASEEKRFHDLYRIDIADEKNYDLVIDTKNNNLQKVIDIVSDAYHAWLSHL